MICNRCKVDKPAVDFIFGKSKCKVCYNKCREYYRTHRRQEIARAQRSNARKDRLEENERKRAACRKNPVAYMLWQVKARAKREGTLFNLTHEDIRIPEKCPILDIPLMMGEGKATANSPSLDRIVPDLGYVRGNVQVISLKANNIKSNATPEEIRKVADYMEAFFK